MPLIDTSSLELQKQAKHPPLFLLIVLILVPIFGLNVAWKALELVFPQSAAALAGRMPFRVGWVSIRVLLGALAAIFVIKRYPAALFAGTNADGKAWSRIVGKGLLCGLPLTLYHVASGVPAAIGLAFLCQPSAHWSPASLQAHNDHMVELHRVVWTPLTYGTDDFGVICASIMVLLFPIFEESVTTGLFFNRMTRRLHLLVAVPLFGVLFALCHVSIAGVSWGLVLLFAMGVSVVVARLAGGSWLSGLVAHWLINLAVMLPRWIFVASMVANGIPRS